MTRERTDRQRDRDSVQNEKRIDELLANDIEASSIARVLFAESMTQNDEYSNLTDMQIVFLSVLMSMNEQLRVNFIKRFIEAFLRLRKSLNAQDRRQAVKIFQSLTSEENERSRLSSIRSFLTGGE